jgi:hypothetical protein
MVPDYSDGRWDMAKDTLSVVLHLSFLAVLDSRCIFELTAKKLPNSLVAQTDAEYSLMFTCCTNYFWVSMFLRCSWTWPQD